MGMIPTCLSQSRSGAAKNSGPQHIRNLVSGVHRLAAELRIHEQNNIAVEIMPIDTATNFAVNPTRSAGLEHLRAFLPNARRRYATDRNSDYGPNNRSNVSTLSGHLRHRLILETEVLEAVLGRYAQSTADKFIQELFWRGYFKGWLEQHPSVWTAYNEDVHRLIAGLDTDKGLAQRYREAIEGRTGIACFDAWSRELVETGYLHNHTRMWFASIWIFTLRLPWQLGADFFYRHLIDGDPASNTLSWRWVGGLHTRGKTYLARFSNIEKFTAGRFAPHGELESSAPPLTEDMTHPKQALRQASSDFRSQQVALLITEEDGHAEELFGDLRPTAGITLLATRARSTLRIGDQAAAFADAAMKDATARAAKHFECSFREPAELVDWGTELADFARDEGVSTIVTAYAPTGPVADRLASARKHLADNGISLCEVRRPYDDLTWPHASRGFFALKKKIPDIIEALQRTVAPRLL